MTELSDIGPESGEVKNVEKLVYSVEQAAELLSIGRTLAYQLIGEGQLPSIKIGHRRLVARVDLEAFVMACREAVA